MSQAARAIEDAARILLNGVELLADLSGALIWPQRRTVLVADLHLEKGSSYAKSGRFLPPYDTATTLQNLQAVVDRHGAERVICLGDSFHDSEAAERLGTADVERLRRLTGQHEWIWIVGNHDPEPPSDWGGRVFHEMTEGALVLRHEALPDAKVAGEISGHFHPKAAIRVRNRRVSGRCFATDGRRLVVPAFGAYTGGLNVLDPALTGLFTRAFRVHLLGRERIFAFPRKALVA